VHPITSLPKPPAKAKTLRVEPSAIPSVGNAAPSEPVMPQPAAVPVEPVAPAATTAPVATGAPVPAAVPAPSDATTAPASIKYPGPPSKSSTPAAAAAAPAPPPADLGPRAVVASIQPAEPVRRVRPESIHAFSTIAVAVKGGFAGAGLDIATPLSKRFNLRVGGSFYSFSGSYNIDGTTMNGEAKFRSGTTSLDWFPFNGTFRISPGITLYNGNNLNATTYVPAGQPFGLGDGDYYSSPTDPIRGTASMTFGKRVAPSLTIGFGNMIPRSGRHFSFPFEIGFQYIGTPPMVNLYLGGSACLDNPNAPGFDPTTCASILSDESDLQQEETEINNDIKILRFYPIISQGFAVRF